MVQEHLIELSVGETLHVGQYRVTLLNVEGDELSLEVEDSGEWGIVVNEAPETVEVC